MQSTKIPHCKHSKQNIQQKLINGIQSVNHNMSQHINQGTRIYSRVWNAFEYVVVFYQYQSGPNPYPYGLLCCTMVVFPLEWQTTARTGNFVKKQSMCELRRNSQQQTLVGSVRSVHSRWTLLVYDYNVSRISLHHIRSRVRLLHHHLNIEKQ